MEKNNLLKKIDEAISTEDMAMPIYVKHLKSGIFWSGLNKEKKDLIKKNLEILEIETLQHAKMLQEIKSLIINKNV